MTNEIIKQIIPSAIGGLIAGLSAATIFKLIELLSRPKLKVYFDSKKTFDIAPSIPFTKLVPGYTPKKEDWRDTLFVHLLVTNVRSKVAKECQFFLLKLEKLVDDKFVDLKLAVHLKLMWSNEPFPKGFSSLEIPGNYPRRVDLIHIPLNHNEFFLQIEPSPRGIPNGFKEGTYRFTIQTQGTNTNKVTKKFLVKWNGEWKKEGVIVKPIKKKKRWFILWPLYIKIGRLIKMNEIIKRTIEKVFNPLGWGLISLGIGLMAVRMGLDNLSRTAYIAIIIVSGIVLILISYFQSKSELRNE